MLTRRRQDNVFCKHENTRKSMEFPTLWKYFWSRLTVVALQRKTLLVTVSFQLIFGCVFFLFMIKYEYQSTACTHLFQWVTGNAHVMPRH